MMGFAPGFPYVGGLDARLSVPRRATPRARVEAGSVAIANGQTAVYPFATPGGWSLIGRTPLRLFDPSRERPSLVRAGDAIVFVPITAIEFERLAARADRR
jgi:inhibitor of KinA